MYVRKRRERGKKKKRKKKKRCKKFLEALFTMAAHYRFLLAITISLFISVNLSKSAKILTVLPIPFNEHQVVYRPLIERLHANGHQLTVLTTDPFFENYENITEIDLSFVYQLDVLNELATVDLEGSDMLRTVFNVMRKIFEAELRSPRVRELLNKRDEYFDVVMVDWSGSSSLMNVFAHHFSAPLVAITNGEPFVNSHEAFGNPSHPVTYPSVFLPFNENLSLIQRIFSVFSTISYRYYYYNEEIPLQNQIVRDVMGYEKEVDMWEIESNADLLLINAYEALNNIRPSVPTTVYLGGLHQKTKTDVLPSQLSDFIKKSEKLVYVNLNGAALSQNPTRLEKLVAALERAGVDIIWNLSDDIVNSTARIYQAFDLDQESILAHSKVMLHISDGGQRNVEDSIHHAVPIFGISYSSSLDHYLYQVEKFECGTMSLIDFDSTGAIEDKLTEAMNSKKLKSNMMRLRGIVKDQPISNSVDRAVWWIEYTVRHAGTKHLRNQHKTLSWFNYLMLDVMLTVLFGFVSVLYTFAYIIKRIRRYSQSLPFERVTRGSKQKVL